MKYIKYIFILFSTILFSQNTIDAKLIKKTELTENQIVGLINFKDPLYIKNNSIVINKESGTLNYSNLQLGDITSVNLFNPLKINVFYKDFNTVILLDNRLSEITKINFNTVKPFRNISHITTGNDNTIWCFNQDSQELELFDYRTNTTRAKTMPVNGNVDQIISNYNYCWILTEKYISQYNYFGSLMLKMKNTGYEQIAENNDNLYLLKGNKLYFKAQKSTEMRAINLPKLLINRFFVTNESLYIYSDEFLHQYQLINE